MDSFLLKFPHPPWEIGSPCRGGWAWWFADPTQNGWALAPRIPHPYELLPPIQFLSKIFFFCLSFTPNFCISFYSRTSSPKFLRFIPLTYFSSLPSRFFLYFFFFTFFVLWFLCWFLFWYLLISTTLLSSLHFLISRLFLLEFCDYKRFCLVPEACTVEMICLFCYFTVLYLPKELKILSSLG